MSAEKMTKYLCNLADKAMMPDLSTMQPKETAPKDGRWFIAYCPGSGMCWEPFEMCAWQDFTYEGVRKQYFCEQDTSDELAFEGWWPLPVIPTQIATQPASADVKELQKQLAEYIGDAILSDDHTQRIQAFRDAVVRENADALAFAMRSNTINATERDNLYRHMRHVLATTHPETYSDAHAYFDTLDEPLIGSDR